MPDQTIAFAAFGDDKAGCLPIKVSDNGDGTYSIAFSADLTVDPTNLALEATQSGISDILSSGIGQPSDAAWDGVSGSASIISLLKKIAINTTPA